MRGVKNFWFGKYGLSASFCTKNHVKIFKTRENRFLWKFRKNRKIDFFFKKMFKKSIFRKFVKFQKIRFLRVFNFFTWFFVQNEAEYPYFRMQKFFTPLTSFLPPFCGPKCVTKKVVFLWFFTLEELQGQKRGVKN